MKELSIAIFRGSPRSHGNTNALTDTVADRLREKGCDVHEFNLYEMTIKPCLACRACQEDWSEASCAQIDDMRQIFDAVMDSELLILATPIYSWYCTPPMKAMLDRLVYAMNMYYGDGDEKGPSFWQGKKVALITTSGYPADKGPDLLEEGIRRYCKHSQLEYTSMLWGRHDGYTIDFMDEEKQRQAVDFADKLLDEDRLLDDDRICPCCGKYYFTEKDAYEICPVCGWEDDPLQRREPDFAGGANTLSLNEAIKNYTEEAEYDE